MIEKPVKLENYPKKLYPALGKIIRGIISEKPRDPFKAGKRIGVAADPHGMKAKLRAWLIDLVREAIRSEWVARQQCENIANSATVESTPKEVSTKFKARLADVSLEPSFEQMQSEAILEQAKFYEVVK